MIINILGFCIGCAITILMFRITDNRRHNKISKSCCELQTQNEEVKKIKSYINYNDIIDLHLSLINKIYSELCEELNSHYISLRAVEIYDSLMCRNILVGLSDLYNNYYGIDVLKYDMYINIDDYTEQCSLSYTNIIKQIILLNIKLFNEKSQYLFLTPMLPTKLKNKIPINIPCNGIFTKLKFNFNEPPVATNIHNML